jgi:hypothetical protein
MFRSTPAVLRSNALRPTKPSILMIAHILKSVLTTELYENGYRNQLDPNSFKCAFFKKHNYFGDWIPSAFFTSCYYIGTQSITKDVPSTGAKSNEPNKECERNGFSSFSS